MVQRTVAAPLRLTLHVAVALVPPPSWRASPPATRWQIKPPTRAKNIDTRPPSNARADVELREKPRKTLNHWLVAPRDSNPCFSLERAAGPVVLARAYAPVSTGRFHFGAEADSFYSVRCVARVELRVVKCA